MKIQRNDHHYSRRTYRISNLPGVALHEISHRFACDLLKVPVFHAFYFIPGSKTAGAVVHEKTTSVLQAFLIGFAPFLINSLGCILFTFPYALAGYVYG